MGLTTREIVLRCLKARAISWLTTSHAHAALPTIDGSHVVIAIYLNGKRVEPEIVQVATGTPPEWGPDGPAQYNQGEPPPNHEEPGDDAS